MKKEYVYFFYEDISRFPIDKELIKVWIRNSVLAEGFNLSILNFIFCSDKYLLKINQKFLRHNYYTDIITFNQSEKPYSLEGDIFISVDRVKYNSLSLNLQFKKELLRVIIHGILHLMGYNDKNPDEKLLIREKENNYILEYSKL